MDNKKRPSGNSYSLVPGVRAKGGGKRQPSIMPDSKPKQKITKSTNLRDKSINSTQKTGRS